MTEPSMTESGIVRKLTELEREQEALRLADMELRRAAAHRGRRTEDVALWVAVGLIVLRSIVELAQETSFVDHVDEAGFPWGFWATCGLLVLPKVVGRASAGRFWEAIGGGIGRRIGGKQPPEGGAG